MAKQLCRGDAIAPRDDISLEIASICCWRSG